MEKLIHRVYYVFSEKDSTVLIALDIYFNERNVRWFDTIKERIMTIEKVIDPSHEHFAFKRVSAEGGAVYTFVPMTLEIYNNKIKHRILSPQELTDQEKLLLAFEETRKNAW